MLHLMAALIFYGSRNSHLLSVVIAPLTDGLSASIFFRAATTLSCVTCASSSMTYLRLRLSIRARGLHVPLSY